MSEQRFVSDVVQVRAPATTANIGPGFDALAAALSISDVIEAQVVESGLRVEVVGEGEQTLARDEQNLVVIAARAAFERLGVCPPGLWIRCRNTIPQARGLGSSAAAIVGGMVAARALVANGRRQLPDTAVLSMAAKLDRSPDNVAACLFGGVVLAWAEAGKDEAGEAIHRVAPLTSAPGITPVVYVPGQQSSTKATCALLPEFVPHRDAVANSGRAALLVHAIAADPSLLFAATEDWLHQRYRAPAMPATAACVRQLRQSGIAAVVSGAGSSVFAMLVSSQEPPTCDGFAIHRLKFDPVGAADSVAATVSVSREPVGP